MRTAVRLPFVHFAHAAFVGAFRFPRFGAHAAAPDNALWSKQGPSQYGRRAGKFFRLGGNCFARAMASAWFAFCNVE